MDEISERLDESRFKSVKSGLEEQTREAFPKREDPEAALAAARVLLAHFVKDVREEERESEASEEDWMRREDFRGVESWGGRLGDGFTKATAEEDAGVEADADADADARGMGGEETESEAEVETGDRS